jgi:acetyl esterase/lipase
VPEHSFSASVNDCTSVTHELFSNAINYRIDVNRIVLTGDSAGGSLALVTTQSLLKDGFKPRSTCLLYPALQFFDFTLPSYQEYLPRNILGIINEDNLLAAIFELSERKVKVTRDVLINNHTSACDKRRLRPLLDADRYLNISLPFDINQEGNQNLIPHLKCLVSSQISPLLISDDELAQLPPILLFTAEFDILRDEGMLIISISILTI